MSPDYVSQVTALGAVLFVAYCLGGIHGIALAWSNAWRFRRWAHREHAAYLRVAPICHQQVDSMGRE